MYNKASSGAVLSGHRVDSGRLQRDERSRELQRNGRVFRLHDAGAGSSCGGEDHDRPGGRFQPGFSFSSLRDVHQISPGRAGTTLAFFLDLMWHFLKGN